MLKTFSKKLLKSLHDEITREIDENKKAFSEEISKTLASFRQNLEQNVTQEIDQKISALFTQHFSDTSSQVKSNFDQMFSPVLKKTEDDMKRLQTQGENTLCSWERMMKQYAYPWTKPFFIMLAASVITATIISLILFFLKTSLAAYIFMDVRAEKAYESDLQWIELKEKARAEREQEEAQTKTEGNKNKSKNKKKSK